jgi:hypothetical protein
MATKLPALTTAANQLVTLTIMLNWSDESGFQTYVKDFEDRASPNYRRSVDLEAQFGPTEQAYQAVLTYLEQKGFALLEGSSNRLTITVSGTRSQAEQAFDVTISDYQLGTRSFYANDSDPAFPSALAPLIRSVSGLSDLAQHQPSNSPNPATSTSDATAYNGALASGSSPTANNSGLPPNINGAGQTIALVEYDNFIQSDLTATLSASSLATSLSSQITSSAIAGGTGASEGQGTQEVLGDIVSILGVAPGANIIVASAPNKTPDIQVINSAFNLLRAATGQFAGTISDSWAQCELQHSPAELDSLETLIKAISLAGVTFFSGTGDTGSTCVNPPGVWPNSLSFPSDVPDAVAVGGTVLQVGAGNTYQSESWWTGGGFGASGHFTRPGFQNQYTNVSGRSVPDVSANAINVVTVCIQGQCGTGSGTSFSTPLWAATWALACQAKSSPCLSAASGYLYTVLNRAAFHQASTMTGVGNDFAHVGLGSPNITNLVSEVAGPPSITSVQPATGPVTGGTTVTITGSNFIGVSGVTFGGSPGAAALSYTVVSETQIVAVTSPCLANPSTFQYPPCGSDQVTVVTPAGNGWSPSGRGFVYYPVITNINPNTGPMAGGTAIAVTGFGFSPVGYNQPFLFGGIQAVNAQCSSTTQCSMATPARSSPGTVDVTYNSPANAAGRFTYLGPTITSVNPSQGGENGGDIVTILGTSFSPSMSLKVGSTSTTNFACVSNTNCILSTPPGKGTVDITVTVNGETSAKTGADAFRYEPLPFGTLSPSVGPYTGGTNIVVKGGNFSTAPGATTFMFSAGVPGGGSALAASVKCSSSSECTMTSPADVGGIVMDVYATANGLTAQIGNFTYTPGPNPYGVMQPNWGPVTGGTVITVDGGNFSTTPGATKFMFEFGSGVASAPATNISCTSSSECTMTSPPRSPQFSGSVVQEVSATAGGLVGSLGPFYYGSSPPPVPNPKKSGPSCVGICQ